MTVTYLYLQLRFESTFVSHIGVAAADILLANANFRVTSYVLPTLNN